MLRNVIVPLVLLTALYGAIITALIWLLHRARIPGRLAIVLGFVGSGLGGAWLAAWIWPLDSCVYPNVWAVLLGDWLYQHSTESLGRPWFLQLPQVYGISGILLYGGLGLLAQAVYGRYKARPGGGEPGRSSLDATA